MIWIPWIIVVLGFVPLLMVWLKKRLIQKSIAKAESATGFVENIQEHIGYKGNRYYVATINFIANHEMIRVNHIAGYGMPSNLKAGQQLVVLYNPKKPAKIHLRDYPYNFRVPWIITSILAIGFISLAYFLYKELNL